MGFAKTASWFSVLGGDKKAAQLNADSMDTVDAMERGFVRAFAREEVKPAVANAPRRKMHVERSEDRLSHVLYNEDLEKVLEARNTAQGVQVFAAGGGDSKVSVDIPAFTLTHDKDQKNWKVASSFCERCTYRNPFNSCQNKGGQTLGFIRHGKEQIGEGTAMCMDVDIPKIDADGQTDVWCPLCQGSDDARIELTSLRPKWNEKLQSLCMDFKGRVEAASAKNFQLCLDDRAVLVYGKKANGTFCLEFEHPLSTAQAFMIALSTVYWT